jgi:hypothetical protein
MSINLRQRIAASLGSILLPMGFINPAGATVVEPDLLDTSSGIAHFGSTHRDSFTDLLEFNFRASSNITVFVAALNALPRYNLGELEAALFTEPSSHNVPKQDSDRHGADNNNDSNHDNNNNKHSETDTRS